MTNDKTVLYKKTLFKLVLRNLLVFFFRTVQNLMCMYSLLSSVLSTNSYYIPE